MWLRERQLIKKIASIPNINVVTSLVVQIEVLTKKLDNLAQNVIMIYQPTPVCEGYREDHTTASYPLAFTHVYQTQELSYVQNSYRQNNPYSNNYNPNWSEHLKFSWANNWGQGFHIQNNLSGFQQQQENKSSFEKLVGQFIPKNETNFLNQQVAIKNLETQMQQIATMSQNEHKVSRQAILKRTHEIGINS